MPEYRRWYVPGGTYFFTAVAHCRQPLFDAEFARRSLREAFDDVRADWEKPSREAILEAFRARRCFAATDNISLVVQCADHLMGEEFSLAGKPTLVIHARGTVPIVKLEIVRNNQYVYSTAPNTAKVDLKWTDVDPSTDRVSYYYVRVQQSDTSLAWSSPFWIHFEAQ